MNKKNILISILIILIILLITIIPNSCYAVHAKPDIGAGAGSGSGSSSDSSTGLGLGDLNNYLGTNTGSVQLEKKANYIFSTIRNIGIVLSVVILIIIGIKYMLGTVEEKANYKETLLPYIIGAFLLFTGSVVPQLIYVFMQNF